MITRESLADYLYRYLVCDEFSDYAPNGMQVEGCSDIRRICTAVTASESVIQEAIAMKADALLVHHGYFWRGESSVIVGMKRRRIALLLAVDMSLFAYHLPLDAHPLIGNNAYLGQLFGVCSVLSHAIGSTPRLLWSGTLDTPMTAEDFGVLIATQLGRLPLHVAGSNKLIHRIAWCSGGAQDYIENAHQLGVDAYISGEISERTYYQAKELGLHYFAAGHHATERGGIRALGDHLGMQFQLEHQFIDSDNPV